MTKKIRDELNNVTDIVNIDNLLKQDSWYTMFRTSLLCYLWSELTEIRFFLKLIMYFNKKTCKSEYFILVKAFENIAEPRGKPFSLYIHTLDSETNAKSTDRSIFGYHPSTWETVSALHLWDFLNQIKIIISMIPFHGRK
jgi:hypothetical protein